MTDRLLLDTHVALWLDSGDDRLRASTRALIVSSADSLITGPMIVSCSEGSPALSVFVFSARKSGTWSE